MMPCPTEAAAKSQARPVFGTKRAVSACERCGAGTLTARARRAHVCEPADLEWSRFAATLILDAFHEAVKLDGLERVHGRNHPRVVECREDLSWLLYDDLGAGGERDGITFGMACGLLDIDAATARAQVAKAIDDWCEAVADQRPAPEPQADDNAAAEGDACGSTRIASLFAQACAIANTLPEIVRWSGHKAITYRARGRVGIVMADVLACDVGDIARIIGVKREHIVRTIDAERVMVRDDFIERLWWIDAQRRAADASPRDLVATGA